MAEPLRHRQTKGAETDMLSLPPPRHISTLPNLPFRGEAGKVRNRREGVIEQDAGDGRLSTHNSTRFCGFSRGPV